MSSGGSGIGIVLALPLVMLVLAAAGVVTAVAQGLALANQRLSVRDLETRLRDRAGRHRGTALQDLLQLPAVTRLMPVPSETWTLQYAEVLRAVDFPAQSPHQTPVLPLQSSPSTEVSAELFSTADLLARAEAISATLEEEQVLRLVAERWHADHLKQAAAARSEANRLLADGSLDEAARLAAIAEQRLTLSAYDAYTRLAQAQHQVAAENLSQVLQTMGYSVNAYTDTRGTALWARSPQRTLAAVVTSSGDAHLDMTGEDLGCAGEMDHIIGAMGERGIDLRIGERTFHGRRDGGTLIREAGRRVRTEGVAAGQAVLDAVSAWAEPQGQPPETGDADDADRIRAARAWFWAAQATRAHQGRVLQ